ncbi:MAG: LapA family protein [Cyanobacteria bacterium P01_E01_bin.34]
MLQCSVSDYYRLAHWLQPFPLSIAQEILSLMRFLQMLIGCLALLMVAVFAGQNTSTVSLRLFRLNSVQLPLGLVLVAAIILGILSSMIFVGIFSKRRRPIQSALKSFR